jgi:chromosomal replication initiation ATPase DnaA
MGAPPSVRHVEKTNRSPLLDECNMTSENFPASGIVVLYGPSGSGKTRLMQAAARYFSVQKGFEILHCCVLDLIQEMVDAIKKGTCHAFRESLMRLDALFIDNVWLLQSRRQAALAVFSLFEAFADQGGLVMIASDLPPSLLSEWSPAKR